MHPEQKNDPPVWIKGIETTNVCYCDCTNCTYHQMTREKGFITMPVFKKAVKNILDHTQKRFITLHHFGDPLLHPKLIKMINFAEKRGIRTKFSTVGSFLTPSLTKKLLKSRLSVLKFSFWGTTKEEFEQNQRCSFDKTMQNIDNFLKKSPKMRVFVEILTKNPSKVTDFAFFEAWEPFLQTKSAGNWIGDDERVNELTGIHPKPVTTPCSKILDGDMKILWNGDVVPCCLDYNGKAVVGNIMKENIYDIWHGEKMNHIRDMHRNGRRAEVELCRYCTWQPCCIVRQHENAS